MHKQLHFDIGQIISLVAQPEFWGKTISTLRSFVWFDTWCVLHYRDGSPHVLSEFDEWDDGKLFSKYLSYYYKLDPFYMTQSEMRQHRWSNLEDIAYPEFYTSEYFIDYLSHFHNHEMALRIDLRNKTYLELSIGKRDRFTPNSWLCCGALLGYFDFYVLSGVFLSWLGELLVRTPSAFIKHLHRPRNT
jgi:hypothetical protein